MKEGTDANFWFALPATLAAVLTVSMVAAPVRAQSLLEPVVTQAASGGRHSCVVTTAGGVKCWGDNTYGQLGDGSTTSRSAPVTVAGLTSGIVSVATGDAHTCAVTTMGGVKCWGRNTYGQLGNNDDALFDSPIPVTVVDDSNTPIGYVVAITAGYAHTCVVNILAGVQCWGYNYDGELGPPNVMGYSITPVTVAAFSDQIENYIPIAGVVAIAAGSYHTCAVTTSGDVECWGYNSDGQLGNGEAGGNTLNSYSPYRAQIAGATGVSAGYIHTCARTTAGGVRCWGGNGADQLGNNDATHAGSAIPVAVVDSSNIPLSGVAAIAAGTFHGCAVMTGGAVQCWGANYNGELGNEAFGNVSTAIPVVDSNSLPISGIVAVAAGAHHTCAQTRLGGLKCWGLNRYGNVGNGAGDAIPQVVVGLGSGMAKVAAGIYQSCALTNAGGVECWGNNLSGQLGNNSQQTTNAPVPVTGLSSGVTAIAVGGYHACALTNAGGVKCWGSGLALGSNTLFSNSSTPVTVVDNGNAPISGITAIAAGASHTCALAPGGTVKCWGVNGTGQLGNNDNTLASQPAAVNVVDSSNVPITGVTAIAAGDQHTCAVTGGGGAVCWGSNNFGELGNNNAGVSLSLTPVAVVDGGNAPISGVASVAAGSAFACARTIAGGVKCWGFNGDSELGNGTFANSYAATNVVIDASSTPLTGIAAISAGIYHACGLTAGGGAKCWGFNGWGELGNSSVDSSNVAIPVVDAGAAPIAGLTTGPGALAAGAYHTCVRTNAGAIECWGSNSIGQLGRGFFSYTPTAVVGLSGSASSITTGDSYTCAGTPAGYVKCWGSNVYGQLGNNDNTGANKPTPVSVVDAGNQAVLGLTHASAGAAHACALMPGGSVGCWGANSNGQLGNNDSSGTKKPTPAVVVDAGNVPLAGIAAVTAGALHSCALTSAGRVLCWGDNSKGQLGNNDNGLAKKYTAVSVVDATNTPITGATALASGGYFSCALFGDAMKCWGDNSSGQLGMGSIGGQSLIPVAVSSLGSAVSSIAAGVFHACAVVAGAAKCWGYNNDGQLGDNSKTTRPAPVPVSGLASGVVRISGGQYHTCAITTGGALQCWGDDSKGQLGINSIVGPSLVPVPVNGLGSGVAAVAAGGLHTCALTAAGAITCWGNNNAGQVGDNSTTTRPAPVGVLAGQSIAFAPPSSAGVGTLTLSATATSALSPTFDTWTPAICTVTGNKVTISAYGLCGVRASQAGNSSTIAAAPQQLRLIVASEEIFGSGFE